MSTSDLFDAAPAGGPDLQRVQELHRLLHHHAHRYYVLDAPRSRTPSTTACSVNSRPSRLRIRNY